MGHLCNRLAPQLSTPYLHSAKFCFATLGVGCVSSLRVKPPHPPLTAALIWKPTVPFSRSHRFGPTKTSKHSGTSEASPSGSTVRGVAPSVGLRDLDRAKDRLLANGSTPTEHGVLTILLQCHRAASLAIGASSHSPKTSSESDTPASTLLSLDASIAEPIERLAEDVSATDKSSDLIDHVSQVAFEVVAHPSVLITPQVLEAYIVVQARLGRPESLPHVLSLYASKSRPHGAPDSVTHVQQDPHRAANAIDPTIVEKALAAAIEAKNLDAAIGVVENTYATKAFIRQKVLRKALFPATVAVTAPLAIYLVASNLAQFQTSFDQRTATAVATAAILAYVGFTGSMGLLAVLTQNDHMRRVTWAPGISLRERWLHEEERAALDKVACSFGFSQAHRYGEEEGAEFQALRQFVLRKGMVLDRVELMEGMT